MKGANWAMLTLSFFLWMSMKKVKLGRYYFLRELTAGQTLKILHLIKKIDVKDINSLSSGIKILRKVVKIAVGRRFKCSHKELIDAFIQIIDSLPVQEYYEITQIANNLEKARQK